MLNGKTVAVVVPAYNEQTQIGVVIETMPDFVDRIVVVNDNSTDQTAEVVKSYIDSMGSSEIIIDCRKTTVVPNRYNEADVLREEINKKLDKLFTDHEIVNDNDQDRIILINHKNNAGVGAAISTGYKWCRDHQIDSTAVMAGDGQMDPDELEDICGPVINSDVDYVKGNRLIHKSAWYVVPRLRFIGNSLLSMMTKVASGYWRISDTQTGYTAISLRALESIDLHAIYKSYGMPNDMLVKLNMCNATIKEIPIKPIYKVGEKSKMKIGKVIPKISRLLVVSFVKRIFLKYFWRDFHPIFLFYLFSFVLAVLNIPFFLLIIQKVIIELGKVSVGIYIAFTLLSISSFQSLFFAMWIDISENDRLYK